MAKAVAGDHPLLRGQPVVVGESGKELPRPELLGTPRTRTLLGYTRRPLHLSDGCTMGLFSYSGSGTANWLFLVDARDLSCRRWEIPNGDIASHGAALGADGNIYLMPYRTGRAYRFRTATGRFEQLASEVPSGELTWDAWGASNGCIYFGTYPNAVFGEYDPASCRWTLWRHVHPGTTYVDTFSEDGQGRIHCRAWGPDEAWLTFDPSSRRFETSDTPSMPDGSVVAGTPPPPQDDSDFTSSVSVEGRRFVMAQPSGRLCELNASGDVVVRGDTGSPGEPGWWLKAAPVAVAGVSFFGAMFRFDLATGRFTTSHVDNLAPGGNPIMFLETIGARCAIGANYSQQNLFTVDTDTGRIVESMSAVARVAGEPMCAVGFSGRAFLGIYVDSLICVFDPDQPFAWGKNPRELIALGDRYAQTRPRAAVTDGRLVYISSDSAYRRLGGALVVVDPLTEQVDVYHHLIRDQNLPTLAYDPSTGLVWGGTDRWGQMRSHPPTQESSLVYAFDPGSRTVAARLTLWPRSDETTVHGISREGILVASSADQIALLDTRSREILYQGPSPVGVPGRLHRGADGHSYGIAGSRLYRWDLARNRMTAVADVGDCSFLTEPSPGRWLLADRSSVYRLEFE